MAILTNEEGTPTGGQDSPLERAKRLVAPMSRQPKEAPGATVEGFDSPVLFPRHARKHWRPKATASGTPLLRLVSHCSLKAGLPRHYRDRR